MSRPFFLLILIALMLGTPTALEAQVLFETEPEGPVRRPASSGTLLGGPSLLANPGLSGAGNGETASPDSSLPGSLGGYTPFSSRYRPGRRGMTREDIVRQRQEQAFQREERIDSELRNAFLEIRTKESLRELFDESDRYIPQVLRKSDVGVSEETPSLAETNGSNPVNRSEDKESSASPTTGSENAGGPVPMTEEERIDKELRDRLAALDNLQDDEEREKQRKALQTRIKSRDDYRERRAKAEQGADFFRMPASLRLRDTQLREGWCNLFDGVTFFGWRTQKDGPYGGGRFTIERNEIRSDPYHPGLLYTTNQFGDMTVSFEFQAEADAEAFLLLRTPPNPRDLMSSCYAVVLNSTDFKRPRGSVLGHHKTSVEHLKEQEAAARSAAQKASEDVGPRRWHKLTAQFDGTRLLIMIDRDEPITIYDAKPLGYGYIGLLVAKGDVRFRNLIWQPGSSLSLFDGINPDNHWRYRQDALKLTATRDLSMQLTGGPGVIETKDEYGNFILQLEYNIAYTSARTGVFFRARPREEQSGYEVSLQNFPTRKDRDTASGVDAGAFRNRKNGRYIRPEDQKWNHLTLVVVDRHFQSWINGVPVCEMGDRRPEADESETGPFLKPGTIQILAPDTNSYFQLRNIRVTPIAPRSIKPRTFSDREQSTWESLLQEGKKREMELRMDEKMRGAAAEE